MAERILTLFGEEVAPEQPAPEQRARSKKESSKKEQKSDGQSGEPADAVLPNNSSIVADNSGESEADGVHHAEDTVAKKSVKKSKNPGVVTEVAGNATNPIAKDIELPTDLDDKRYHTIGEVAAMFDVNTSHIRFWTIEFALKVRTTKKGDRLYTPEQVRYIKSVYHLVKEKGFTLAGAKARLKEKKNFSDRLDLRESLLQLRNRLVKLKKNL